MYPVIKNVQAQDDYTLFLVYENDEKRCIDMKPFLNHKAFIGLSDIKVFKSVKTSFDTIEWANEIDIDPEFLYQNSQKIV